MKNLLALLLLLLLPVTALAQTNLSAESNKNFAPPSQSIISAAAGASVDVKGYSYVLIQYSGTYTQNATAAGFELSLDNGTIWENADFYVRGTINSCLYRSVTGDLADNSTNWFLVPTNGADLLRTEALNWATGTITVKFKADSGPIPCIQTANFPALNFATDSVDARGAAADGAAVVGNPVLVAGQDGANVQTLKTDNTGSLQVDIESAPSLTIGTFPDNEPINVAQVNGVTPSMGNGISSANVLRVTVANDSTGVVGLNTGSNVIGSLTANQSVNTAQINGVTPLMGAGNGGTGSLRVNIASDQLKVPAAISQTTTDNDVDATIVGTPTVTVGTFPDNEPFNVAQINGVTPLMGAGATGTGSHRTTEANDSQLSAGIGATSDAAPAVGAAGSATSKLRLMTTQLDAIQAALQLIDDDQTGASVNYRTSVGTTEDETEIKATAGRLFSVNVTNTAATVAYFRCYNLTAANTTPGTSTVFLGLAIPGATTGAGFVANYGPAGIAFSTALTCTLTTGAADTDVAEVAANEIKWTIGFK